MDSSHPDLEAVSHETHHTASPDTTEWLGLNFAWELGYTIAIPAVVLGIGGAYLDKFLHTSPLFVLLGFAFAFSISFVQVMRKVKEILRRTPKDLPSVPKEDDIQKSHAEVLHEQFRPKC